MKANDVRNCCLFIMITLVTACSSNPTWPADIKKDQVVLIGPLYDTEVEDDYHNSSLLREAIYDLQKIQEQKKTSDKPLPDYIQIKPIDWVIKRKSNLKTWRQVLQASYFGDHFYDNLKLAEILLEDEDHEAPYVLALHMPPSDREHPEKLIFEGYRFYREDDTAEANWFKATISIKDKKPLTEIKKTIQRLLLSDDFASPSFGNMGFIRFEGGCFKMGDQFRTGDVDERPVHEECISPFLIGKYPVTQSQWQSVMGHNPSNGKIHGFHPVENVAWNDVMIFIDRLNDLSDRSYRLPTEAEWEYACRNGGKKVEYPLQQGEGPNIDQTKANLNGVSEKDQWSNTSPVGSFPPNQSGVFDMAGNVWEWTEDYYFKHAYRGDTPLFKGRDTKNRATRGGSFDSVALEARCSMRGFLGQHIRNGDIGFRLVQDD